MYTCIYPAACDRAPVAAGSACFLPATPEGVAAAKYSKIENSKPEMDKSLRWHFLHQSFLTAKNN